VTGCPRCGETALFRDDGVCGRCGGTFETSQPSWWVRWGWLVAVAVVSFVVAGLIALAVVDPQ
jgi:uncharacterized paraquat-inducible protein A